MKKLLSLLTLLTVALTATAQITNTIVIDRSSFRAVQKDALTGANVDPIGVDHSRRACARLKIFFHKMTREQLAQLDAIFPSGTIEKTKIKVADYENILILEMTAKPQVAFYLKHPTFGTSNEVALSLEGNKEYQIEATLNQTFSIVVNSNVEGAEVYLDGAFKGQTNSNFLCTIADVMIGEHKLKVVYDNSSSEKSIEVNRNSISFRQNVDVAVATPQHVLFEVSPVGIDAMVQVAGVFLPIKNGGNGVVDQLLAPGNYQFIVTAPNYHPYSGEVAVRDKSVKASVILNPAFGILNINGDSVYGAEVYVDNTQQNAVSNLQLPSGEHTVRIIKSRYKPYQTVVNILDGHTVSITPTLEPNFASVTIKASSPDVEIWLNDSYKSNGTYTAELDFGSYKVEGRKKSHSSTPQTFYVAESEPKTVELNAPEPIYGSIIVEGNTTNAQVALDGEIIGQLPLKLDNVLIGEHTLTAYKEGYVPYTQTVTITEGVTITVTANLQNTYKVGDYYNDGKREGVVFEVSADGRHGKIVSMTQSVVALQWSSNIKEQKRCIGANSDTDGAYNMAKVKARPDWQSKYPAFKWCADLGEGWYLPSKEELLIIYKNKEKLNSKFSLNNKLNYGWYWSSTEIDRQYSDGTFCARLVRMNGGYPYGSIKTSNRHVRAVSAF
ncbi:MAG: PEGA domain-containing protein [Alistipes sp.]|nr:PEGA domain-containing protein [Alistipes sp.]